MGFFTKDSAPAAGSAGGIAPITKDRIKKALEAQGWAYDVDTDGDIGGGWEYGSFFFILNGNEEEIFCVRGIWRGKLEEADYLKALETANAWNRDRIWPKAYVGRDDEGMVRLNTEVNVDYEHGLTDEMLTQHLLCALNTGMGFFEHVNETFPEAWEKYRPKD